MLSKKELLELKDLAFNCEPFADNYGKDFKYDVEEYNRRVGNNKELFLACFENLPDLIDELLELRKQENETDEMTIYEGEVHIVNNYTTNYVDMEEIEKKIISTIQSVLTKDLGCCKNE